MTSEKGGSMNRSTICMLLFAAIAGCKPFADQKDSDANAATAQPPTVAQTKRPTKTEFLKAVSSAFTESEIKDSGTGSVEFKACFEADGSECKMSVWGRRDGFTGNTFFVPHITRWIAGSREPRVEVHAAIGMCELPDILITAIFESPDSWIFINRFAIMLNGEVEFERFFEYDQVSRDNDRSGVIERAALIPSNHEMEALRRIANGESIIVRISGEKGYVTPTKEQHKNFQKALKEAMTVRDKITAAIDAIGGPDCETQHRSH